MIAIIINGNSPLKYDGLKDPNEDEQLAIKRKEAYDASEQELKNAYRNMD